MTEESADPKNDTMGQEIPQSTDILKPTDTSQDIPKPDTDMKTSKPDTVPPKDTVSPKKDTTPVFPNGKDTQGSKPETEEEEESSGGGSGGCSVTW